MSVTKDVSVRLSLNGADDVKAKLTSVTEQADKLGTRTAVLTIEAKDDEWNIEADKVLAQAKELGATKVRVEVTADTTHASLAMDHIRAQADELGLKKVNIKVNIDDSDLKETENKIGFLSRLLNHLPGLNGGGSGVIGGASSGIIGGATTAGGEAGGESALAGLPFIGVLIENPELIPAVLAGIGALVTEAGGLVTGLSAVGLGIGSMIALGIPAFEQISGAIGDTKNQLDKLPKPIQDAVGELKGLKNEYEQMAKAFTPTALGLFNQALPIAHNVLPYAGSAANAAAPAVGDVLKGFDDATKSPGFKKFMDFLESLEGPVIKTIGSGLLTLSGDIAHMMELFSKADVIDAFRDAFHVLDGTINTLDGIIIISKAVWDTLDATLHAARDAFRDVNTAVTNFLAWLGKLGSEGASAVTNFSDSVLNKIGSIISWFGGLPGKIISALGNLGKVLWNAGVQMIAGFLGGIEEKFNDVKNFIGGIGSWIAAHKGPIEYDATLLIPHGKAIMGGLVTGLESGMSGLNSQLARVTNAVSSTGISGSGGSGAGTTINFNNLVTDPDATARKIQQLLSNLKRHNGNRELGLA